MIVPPSDVADKSFDYIIIGAGTSGLTLAGRLTEDPSISVLVLEAGDANIDDPAILRPASFGSHFGIPALVWPHMTMAQKGADGRETPWFRGKGLGGSSSINFLCWTKPPARDINDIEKLGNPGWNWKNFEKYCAKAEGFFEPTQEVQKKYSMRFDKWRIGRDGPLKLAYPATIEDAEIRIQQAYMNNGIAVAPLPMSGNPAGVFFIPLTYDPKKHTRTYATTAYYTPNKDRANFTVALGALVHRVETTKDATGKVRATGVHFSNGNDVHFVRAAREVIVSAGALKTPQILELSGIGRRSILDKINIPVQIDLPWVGENVQEHIFAQLTWELREDVKFDTLDLLRDPVLAAKHLELHTQGSGLYTTGIVGFGFTTLDQITPKAADLYAHMKNVIAETDYSDLPPSTREQYELMLARFSTTNGSPGCEFISYPGFFSSPNPPEAGKRYITIFAATNYMFSRGTIHCNTSDPTKDPVYDAKYFENSIDLAVLVEMCKFARKVVDTSPFKEMIVKEINPGPEIQTDEQLAQWIKPSFSPTWHTIGSCPMLPREKGGVVDPSLKVYGTENIRIADLSVLPLHFASHTQSPAYTIGEQAADIIKGNFVA